MPILDELGFPSVVFVPTAYVGRMNEFDSGEEPGEPICAGTICGCWRNTDVPCNRTACITCQCELERRRSSRDRRVNAIEDGLGSPVTTFAFPWRRGTYPARRALLQAGGYQASFLYGGGPADFRSTTAITSRESRWNGHGSPRAAGLIGESLTTDVWLRAARSPTSRRRPAVDPPQLGWASQLPDA
jgi:hypothetical protein